MCSIKRKDITLRLENDRFYTGITGLSIEPLKEGVQNNLLRHFLCHISVSNMWFH